MRTSTAERELIAATQSPETAAEAHYWLGRIYEFKGNAEGVFPGFHEQIECRPRAEAEFKAAGPPKPEWIAEADKQGSDLKDADALIASLQRDPGSSAAAIRSAIEARIKLRPDPAPYSAGANLLLARNADLPFVLQLAADGRTAGDRFIHENESSFKLGGKVQAFLDRNAGTFADLAGWALFLQGNMTAAEERLAEAARFFHNNDVTNQMHLGDLSARLGDLSTAEDHYLNVMDLATVPDNQGLIARRKILQLRAGTGESEADSRAWLVEMTDRKRQQRREAMTADMLGRELPALVLKDLAGNEVSVRALQGKIVLLNFFAAWCGACRQEMPKLQAAYEIYQHDPAVRFVLVSVDDDPARLDKYVAERKFSMPVLRFNREDAGRLFGVVDTPTTFYIDKSGTIQFQVVGVEPHGDAVDRVKWYIDTLKAQK